MASIQQRTSLTKFDHLAENSENGSISNLSTKGESAAAPPEAVCQCKQHWLGCRIGSTDELGQYKFDPQTGKPLSPSEEHCDHGECKYLAIRYLICNFILVCIPVIGPLISGCATIYVVYYTMYVGDCAGQSLWDAWTEDNGINMDDVGFWCGFLIFTTALTIIALSCTCAMGCCMAVLRPMSRVSVTPSLDIDRDVQSILGLEDEKDGRAALQAPLLQDKKNP